MSFGAGNLPGREWMIKDAKGRKYSYDSIEEAREELADFGEGATLWTREFYRVMFITKSVLGSQQIDPAPVDAEQRSAS